MLTKQNGQRFASCWDQTGRDLALPLTPNMHTDSPDPPVQCRVPSSSSIASISTPVDKAEWTKIRVLWRPNLKRFGLATHTQYAYWLPDPPCCSVSGTIILLNSINLHTCWQSWRGKDSGHVETKLEEIWPCHSHSICIPPYSVSSSSILLNSVILHTYWQSHICYDLWCVETKLEEIWSWYGHPRSISTTQSALWCHQLHHPPQFPHLLIKTYLLRFMTCGLSKCNKI